MIFGSDFWRNLIDLLLLLDFCGLKCNFGFDFLLYAAVDGCYLLVNICALKIQVFYDIFRVLYHFYLLLILSVDLKQGYQLFVSRCLHACLLKLLLEFMKCFLSRLQLLFILGYFSFVLFELSLKLLKQYFVKSIETPLLTLQGRQALSDSLLLIFKSSQFFLNVGSQSFEHLKFFV